MADHRYFVEWIEHIRGVWIASINTLEKDNRFIITIYDRYYTLPMWIRTLIDELIKLYFCGEQSWISIIEKGRYRYLKVWFNFKDYLYPFSIVRCNE